MSNLFKKGVTALKSIFRKGDDTLQSALKKNGTGLDLHDVIKSSYKEDLRDDLGKDAGYIYDKDLSSSTEAFYYNPEKNKLVMSVRGTASLDDVKTDFEMLRGRLKDTDRYKRADTSLKKAKEKYSGYDTTITGHSLGSAISSRIASGNDKVISYNKAEVGGKKNKKEISIRDSGDIISGLGMFGSHTLTSGGRLSNPFDWFKSHNLKNIKNKGFIM